MILVIAVIDELEDLWGGLALVLLLILSIIFICMPIALLVDYSTTKKTNAKYEQIKEQISRKTELLPKVDFKSDENDDSSACTSKVSIYSKDLVELKKLLDLGIITKEEFDAKKKQLLGL